MRAWWVHPDYRCGVLGQYFLHFGGFVKANVEHDNDSIFDVVIKKVLENRF